MTVTLRKPLRFSAILALTCLLGACVQWQGLTPLIPKQIGPLVLDSTNTYLLQLTSGDTLIVNDAHVEGDSVIWNAPERRALALSDIGSTAVQKFDPVTTVGSVGMLAAFFGLLVIAAQHFNPWGGSF